MRLEVKKEVPLQKCSGSGILYASKKWLEWGIKRGDEINGHYKPLSMSLPLVIGLV